MKASFYNAQRKRLIFFPFFFLIIFTLLLAPKAQWTSPSFGDYVKKGDRNIAIIERLSFKYPLNSLKRNLALEVTRNWKSTKAAYPGKDKTERQNLYDTIRVHYVTTIGLLRDISLDIANVYDELYTPLNTAIYNAKLDAKKKGLVYERLQIASQEKTRAQKAFRSRQYYYSAHLYDRSVTILLNLYSDLSIEIPSAGKGIVL